MDCEHHEKVGQETEIVTNADHISVETVTLRFFRKQTYFTLTSHETKVNEANVT